MSDPIPADEDEISKRSLWQRIDHTRDLFEKAKGDFDYHVRTIGEKTVTELNAKTKEIKNFMEKFDREIDAKLSDFEKNIQKTLEKTVSDLQMRLDETIGRMEVKVNLLQNSTYQKIDDAVASFSTESKDGRMATKKELEVVLNNAVSSMQARITDLRRYLDIRLNGLDETMIHKIESDLNKRLAELTEKSKDAVDALEECRKETAASITKYQAETMAGVRKVEETFRQIREKFSLISKSLQ